MKIKHWLQLTAGALAMAHALGAGAQTKGGTLSMIVQPEPPIIVTAINQQAPTQYVAGKIYESLLTYSHDLKPQPGLAKSWEMSADGRVFTFHLRKGMKWSDGVELTSADFKFTMDELLTNTGFTAIQLPWLRSEGELPVVETPDP